MRREQGEYRAGTVEFSVSRALTCCWIGITARWYLRIDLGGEETGDYYRVQETSRGSWSWDPEC